MKEMFLNNGGALTSRRLKDAPSFFRSSVSIVEITLLNPKKPPKTISFYLVESKMTPGEYLAVFMFGNLCGF